MTGTQTLSAMLPVSLTERHRRHQVERTVRRTYAGWRARFPRWANSGFDEYFLLNDALPILNDMLVGKQYPDPSQLAHKWVTTYGIAPERRPGAVAEATLVAADFMTLLQMEYWTQQA